MATTKTSKANGRRRGSGSARARGATNGRSASQKPDKYRFAQNVGGEATIPERVYRAYAAGDEQDPGGEPDVLLDVPVVKVDAIHLELDDLDAHLALQARVLDLVNLNVGVDVHLGKVALDIKGVEAQALVKVRLDHVAAIVDRVLTTLDRNPELLEGVGRAVEDVGSGAGRTLSETGEAVDEVGEGAEQAVGDVGEGAGQAVGDVGEGAGQAVGDVGEGAGQAVGDVGQGAGEAVGNLDQTVGNIAQGAGQAAGQLGQVAGDAGGGGGEGGGGGGGGLPGAGGPAQAAKLAARTVAQEIGSAASDEAKELGLAATRRVKELGERRRRRLAEKHNATAAAMKLAEELGVNLRDLDGSGADGRITVRDVRDASED